MLKETRESNTGIAWLKSGTRHQPLQKALRIHNLSAGPSNSVLNFFAPDFALNQATPWLTGEEVPWSQPATQSLPALIHRVDPSSSEFESQHEEILACIASGEFQKVVPVVFEELEFASNISHTMFPVEPSEFQYAYGFEFQGEGMSGNTPEVLFSVRGDRLETMALAGTGAVEGPSLLNDSKERLEHQLVIEHITTELKIWGDVEVGETGERVYGRLKHLHTPIAARLRREPEFMKLVVSLHPTAALGGWPRGPALKWLERQNFHLVRRRFGAPFGYIQGEEMMCVVAIRAVQWWGACAMIATGCGVVQGSQVLREWAELELKREAIYQSLRMAR